MENFEERLSSDLENIDTPEPAQAPEPEVCEAETDHCYRGEGAGRVETTAAEPARHYQPLPEYTYQPTQPETAEPEKKKRPGKGLWKRLAAAAAALALVAGSCFITAAQVNDRWEARAHAMEKHFQQEIEDLQDQLDKHMQENEGSTVGGISASYQASPVAQVYAHNVRSVVLIECTVVSSYFGQPTTGSSAGTGFILSEDGYLLTNYHVVEGATSVRVSMTDGSVYAARVVGYDSTNDIALLKVDATGLDPVTIGSSDALIVGDQVAAIGNPLGDLTSTLTVGYVSAKERSVSTDGTVINMIQTDCAINSGNSGGPLFNMKGEVVGITTAKYSGSSASGASIEGIGFAIPMDDIMDIIAQLKEFGYVKSGYMGVVVRDLDADVAAVYGLPVGAYVDSVEANGPAANAGIRAKDIITQVGEQPIRSINDLTRILRDFEPGDIVDVIIYRGGQVITLQVELAERPRDLG